MSEDNRQCVVHAEAIARLETANRFRDETLSEIKEDVKAIKTYLEQQKGAVRVVALISGTIGSMLTFFGQFIFNGFKQ